MAAKNGKYTREMKQQAVAYFNSNQVPKQLEDLLNRMFTEKPEDIYGYMVSSSHWSALCTGHS